MSQPNRRSAIRQHRQASTSGQELSARVEEARVLTENSRFW